MTQRSVVIIKVALWAACLAPFALLVLQAFGYAAGSARTPSRPILNVCGKTGLNLLMLTLCITPIRRSTGINRLVVFRRLLGLFAFFYLATALPDLRAARPRALFAPRDGLGDAARATSPNARTSRSGFTALVLLIPLAATSTRGMQRRLGQELGEAAPARLRRRRARRRALLVAGEIRLGLSPSRCSTRSAGRATRRTAQAPASTRESRRGGVVSARRATTSPARNPATSATTTAGITHDERQRVAVALEAVPRSSGSRPAGARPCLGSLRPSPSSPVARCEPSELAAPRRPAPSSAAAAACFEAGRSRASSSSTRAAAGFVGDEEHRLDPAFAAVVQAGPARSSRCARAPRPRVPLTRLSNGRSLVSDAAWMPSRKAVGHVGGFGRRRRRHPASAKARSARSSIDGSPT